MTRQLMVAMLACVLAGGAVGRADTERLKDAAAVLTEMAGSFDKGIPAGLLQRAKCVAIVPSVKKFALGVGGQFGRGYISCRQGETWSAPGAIRIEGGSIGFQIGGSATDYILIVQNDRGATKLLSSKFTVGADAGVAAGPVGRQASAQTDATLVAEILAWSRSRGLFAGISLNGSTLREDGDENKELYGSELSNKQIVGGETPIPKDAQVLIDALNKVTK